MAAQNMGVNVTNGVSTKAKVLYFSADQFPFQRYEISAEK